MNRDELIRKWLDHDLSPQELEAFKQLEDYHALTALDAQLKELRSPSFDSDAALKKVQTTIGNKQNRRKRILPLLSKIAAVLVICLSIYVFTSSDDTIINTVASEHKNLSLPDHSEVYLNAVSHIAFNESSWEDNRQVHLDGEAFFKVSKGETFEVITNTGVVSVLGTQFNVKHREHYFEVTCFEGNVRVQTPTKIDTLMAGDRFLLMDGNYIATEKEAFKNPSWLHHHSTFKSVPYQEVIAEFERQYNVTVSHTNIDVSKSFTGSFTHNDIEIALKSITLPLQLKYSKTDHIIRLRRE